ncbi:MBL fold metallo-hydrolase, partial [Candidatus Dojkabacteria bacterium]|nr:MBL fold metallo-hydrolase [Candidatus Dojkabacteria bacterium]
MNSIKVLTEGYARMNDDEIMYASSSTILITSNDVRVLVDPGTSPNLLEKLKEVNLGPDSIDFIFLTHFHIDHVLNIRFFPNTPILDSETIYTGDKESFYSDIIPGTEIQV